jgi:hypothetical protein
LTPSDQSADLGIGALSAGVKRFAGAPFVPSSESIAMAKRDQKTFEALQAKYRAADERADRIRASLKAQYGHQWRAPAGKERKLNEAQAKADSAMEAIFAWLDANSPRDWRHGAPCYWVCAELSYEDAITAGQLSVIPPVVYGCYESDSRRFAAPIERVTFNLPAVTSYDAEQLTLDDCSIDLGAPDESLAEIG